MDSSARILAKRYARAYMGLDGKAHTPALEAAAHGKLEGLRKVFEAARPHLKVLTHPALNSEMKLLVLGKVLGPANTGPAAAFADLLVRQNRFGLLEDIMQGCLHLNDIFCGVVRAEVYSRYPLSEGEVKRITALLAASSGRITSRLPPPVFTERVGTAVLARGSRRRYRHRPTMATA